MEEETGRREMELNLMRMKLKISRLKSMLMINKLTSLSPNFEPNPSINPSPKSPKIKSKMRISEYGLLGQLGVAITI